MTATTAGEMCRLVVCGPQRQVELAVPGHVAVADLLPALLHHLGEELADTGLEHGGWVLQRTGRAPVDEEASVASLGLHDGELLHLRPRSDEIAEADFDDMIDGLAAGVHERSGRWQPAMARWSAAGLSGVLLMLSFVALGLDGPGNTRALAAAIAGGLALAASFAVNRAVGEPVFAALLAAAGIGHLGLAGLILPGGPIGPGLTAPQVLAGSAAAGAAALVAAGLLGVAVPLFVAVTAALALSLAGGIIGGFGGLDAGQAAAVVVVAATLLIPAVPLLAFRLAGLRLAPLPTQAEHLQEDIEPEPAAELRSRATATDNRMTGLYAGLGAATTVAMILTGAEPGWAPRLLTGLAAVAWLLAIRPMTSAWHRLAQAVPAIAGLTSLAVTGLAALPAELRPVTLVVPLAVVPALLVIGRTMPRRRLMPYWGRAGDLLQTVATIALLPLLLAVLSVYGWFRAIGG
ncbi:MAG TPA: type VII secretion integral membrane protein EccD [Actinoplanes sp.]|nr:type VII secretion integral membrane protein EccD [Actinoplanes sp.]